MVCRLCLIDTDKSIYIFSEEKIQKCIAKFLQLELLPDDPVSSEICGCCWQRLDSFEDFCKQIEQAQKTLREPVCEVKQNAQVPNAVEWTSLVQNTAPSNRPVLISDLIKPKENDEEEEEEVSDYDFPYNNDTPVPAGSDHSDSNKLLNEEMSSPRADKEDIPLRRLTRSRTVKKYKNESDEAFESNPIRNKRGRMKKNDAKNDEVLQETHVTKEETTKPSTFSSASLEPDPNAKRKRGRPKKGEHITPKIKKPRSEQCTKILQTAKEFDAIIQKHMNLSCNICSVRLIDFAELKRHFRAVHNRRGYAVCCNKRLFKRGLVVDHINVHNDPEHFKCNKCGKVLSDRMCLRNHDLLFHQTDELKTFQCPDCPKKYAKQYLLDQHTVKHVPQDECTFFCAECGKGFPTNSTLTKHINQIHLTIYDKMCEICAKLIRGNANFDRHMEEHEGIVQPQVQCTICNSWLKNKNSLRKHMYKHDGKTYVCSICDKNAPTKSALQSHMRYVHELTRMFHCTFCDKSFKKAVILKEHMATHTGEVLYTCPHCPKTFNSKANMHSHRKKKHREEWEANRRYLKKELKSEIT